MKQTLSRDGTPLAFDRSGKGPTLILVDGALCYRASGPSGPLAALLAEHFTVLTYLVMDGGKSPAWMRHAMRALADVLPNAKYRTLEGQTHMLKPKALVPALVEFFRA